MTERQKNVSELASKYAQPRSPAVEELMRRVLGTSVANGYTTIQQAAELSRLLRVGVGDAVLDLGSGRGWPGLHVADETGCRVVLSDLTVEAAGAARASVRGAARPVPIVVASGTALPFRPSEFNAVVHADVLC